ncbi:MAG: efflux RND transporter periplasmic adaptor subunit [Myxococcota bacterium]
MAIAFDVSPEPSTEDLAVLEPPHLQVGWWIGGGLFLLAFMVAAVVWSNGDREHGYDTVSLTTGSLTQRVTAVGQLEPVHHVEVGSDLNGEVLEIGVEVNHPVTSGQMLARLDPEPFENATAQRRAQAQSSAASLEKAEIDLKRAETALGRTERLQGRGAATEVEHDNARLDVEVAQALVRVAQASRDQARASLAQAEQDLRDTVIASPIDGVVVRRHVEEGQTVVSAMAATPLFEVASDLNALKVVVEVDEADVGRVNAGQTAEFTVTAWPGETFNATVRSVDLAADDRATVVVYGTELRVANVDGRLRPGMTATAQIQVGQIDDALLVPTQALRFRPDRRDTPTGDHLWTLNDGQLTPVPVQVGGSDGSLTAVYGDDLVEGLSVVIGGTR